MAAPPMALPARIADPDSLAFRHVQVTGTLRHDKELFVAAVSRRGNDGYQIVTPLIRAAGPPVLVNRGWVPKDRKDPSRRLPGQVEGTVTIDGIARLRQVRSGLIPENQPGQNLWFTMDLPAMAAAAGLPEVAPVYVEAGPAPIPASTRWAARPASACRTITCNMPPPGSCWRLPWVSSTSSITARSRPARTDGDEAPAGCRHACPHRARDPKMNAQARLFDRIRRISILGEATGMLHWDAAAVMPDGGARRAPSNWPPCANCRTPC